MDKFYGKTVFPGIAFGNIAIIQNTESKIRRMSVADPAAEAERFLTAMDMARLHLENLYHKTANELGKENAEIFAAQQVMLDDASFQDAILAIIKEQSVNAEYAVAKTRADYTKAFAEMEDAYIKERISDLKDLSKRLVRLLQNVAEENRELPERCVIVADDLSPSEIIRLNRKNVIALVLRQGSAHSHTAILARAMNIPVIIHVPLPEDIEGSLLIVNSRESFVLLNPGEEEIKKAQKQVSAEEKEARKLSELKGQPTETKSGQKIRLLANIGSLNDLEYAVLNDAEGIGLFRSEFLYMEKSDYPTEDEQLNFYRLAAETMAGKEVIIRTLDVGSNKHIEYFNQTYEENPALGMRGVRFSLNGENIFRTQLRAIYRASAYGKISILIPMITSRDEIIKVKAIITAIKTELTNENKKFGKPLFGIMIETPAAAIIAPELAKEVDFFSIGTNDLTQYTLAVDSQNPSLDSYLNPRHPAIFELIKHTATAAHNANIRLSICGELAADPHFTPKFLHLGIHDLSVLPSLILPLRKQIRALD